jgi:hypothetical protein
LIVVLFCGSFSVVTYLLLVTEKLKNTGSFLLEAWRSRQKIVQDPEPDPLVSGTDPRIRIRSKISQIHNTGLFLGAGREQAGGVGGQPQLRALPRPGDDVRLLRQAFKLTKYLCLGAERTYPYVCSLSEANQSIADLDSGADPGCLSRIQICYPSGSRILDTGSNNISKRRGIKLVVFPLFVALYFTKLKIIKFYRKRFDSIDKEF